MKSPGNVALSTTCNFVLLLSPPQPASTPLPACPQSRPLTEAVLAETVDVVGTCAYFLENLDALTKKEKLPAPLSQYPLHFEVQYTGACLKNLLGLTFQDPVLCCRDCHSSSRIVCLHCYKLVAARSIRFLPVTFSGAMTIVYCYKRCMAEKF